jgi:hypothetical protein
MEFASEHVGNWTAYRLFQEALERVGWENFAILRAELPNANGGLMSAKSAKAALAELARFRQLSTTGQNAALIDSGTGQVIFQHVGAYEGVFILDGHVGIDIGVGEFEFFIRKHDSGIDLFRATHIQQSFLDGQPSAVRYLGRVEYRDAETGESVVCTVPLGYTVPWPDGRFQDEKGQWRHVYPGEFHVERREALPSQFEYTVSALARLFEASVKTGNPVRWS